MSDSTQLEEQIRQLVAAFQTYQAEADAIVRQLSLTQVAADELERAITATTAMESSSEGQEILVPIGSGSFIHARLAATDKIVLNVGAGIAIEKDVPSALQSLKSRKSEVAEGSRKLNEMLGSIQQEMAKIQSALEKYEMAARSEVVV